MNSADWVSAFIASESWGVGAVARVEGLGVGAPERLAQRAQRLGERLGVVLGRCVEQADQVEPLAETELADHPGVDEGQHAGVEIDEHVAEVRVGVEEAVDQDHLDRRPDRVVGDRLRVEAGGQDRVAIVGLDAGMNSVVSTRWRESSRTTSGTATPDSGSRLRASRRAF